jgi:Glycosyl hydrolase family 115/Gylcosyl hydrolase family 115 C-terminal domain
MERSTRRKLFRLRTIILLVLSAGYGLTAGVSFAAASSWVKDDYRRGDFKLVHGARPADILVAPEDFKVVQIAANDLSADVERVTGKRPALRTTAAANLSDHAVMVGTLGRSPFVEKLVRDGKLDVIRLRGQWESFLIATVSNPLPGVRMGLVIVGSDRRGTAYGVYELSQAIGVSPWYWWADAQPARRARLIVSAGVRREGPPSVQYRGIFLNDEDWGLQPWAAKTFEPERGDIGPKTYARIFELLLRLKANTLWPAMHKVTRPFNDNPHNRVVADDYAIVMGSSHAEPMLRNNVGEWKDDPKAYDYTKNPVGVRRYWEERVRENGRFENVYTLGMRGIHDSAIQGPKTQPERIKLVEQIFRVQRELLAAHVSPDVTKVPQIFVPYKEVLADYRSGLKVPDDVTIVWPDDNFGHIRYFPTKEERKRPGGFGVYYHISYLGQPLSYIWLNTTPPALIWEEMTKAYEHGVRKFWMVNVGDIKPGEIGMEFFMQMAWDIKRWPRERLSEFLHEWAQREFGPRDAGEIARVMDEYYRLGYARKPEHLQWYLPKEKPRPSDLTQIDYGDEAQARLDAYESLLARVNRLYASMPQHRKDAFYEFAAYPVRAAALANQRYFFTEKCAFYLEQGRASAREWARRAQEADARLSAENAFFNERLAGGKWRHMMAMEMGQGEWMSMRSSPPVLPPALAQLSLKETAGLGTAIEGRREPLRANEKDAALPVLSVFTRDARFIDVFNTGLSPAPWSARASHNWIKLSRTAGDLRDDARILVSIDWAHAPKGESVAGAIEISAVGETRTVLVPVFNPHSPRPVELSGFVESGGVVAMEAESFTRRIDRAQAGWRVIPGLGRTGNSVAVFPTDADSIDEAGLSDQAPVLEYRFHLFNPGKLNVTYYLVPTLPLIAGRGLRFAVALDNEGPQVVAVGTGLAVPSKQWSQNVLNAVTIGSTILDVRAPGPHVLKIYMVDAGVVLDKIVMDNGGARPSYLGPRETAIGTGRGN